MLTITFLCTLEQGITGLVNAVKHIIPMVLKLANLKAYIAHIFIVEEMKLLVLNLQTVMRFAMVATLFSLGKGKNIDHGK